MNKIPTLYVRDVDDPKQVTDEISEGCEWVLEGEGVATRKWDGTCVMLDEAGEWWARREVKKGKKAPDNFVEISTDEATGKTVGWEPIAQSGFAKWHEAALDAVKFQFAGLTAGTYELCGPRVNRNPDNLDGHQLLRHGVERVVLFGIPHDDPAVLIDYCKTVGWEGIVWHHHDGRMAKLKVRDYPGPVE